MGGSSANANWQRLEVFGSSLSSLIDLKMGIRANQHQLLTSISAMSKSRHPKQKGLCALKFNWNGEFKRQSGSHEKTHEHEGYHGLSSLLSHEGVEIGPSMLVQIGQATGP